jgi:phosphatidylethanolamine/phosphatidyl-N-methylethanolamine N-methyltransferase
MAVRLKRHISQKFDNEIRFFKGMINGPKTVGAIAPTSVYTARRMASVIDLDSDLPVLELGPGTGVITRAILERGVPAEKLVAIEYSADFHSRLVEDFPGIKVIHGDAFDLARTLAPFDDVKFQTVISGIPLLNFPMAMRIKLLEDLLSRMPAGRPVIQFSYGPVSPIAPKPGSYHIQHFDFMIRNLPPAQLWIYRRG